MRQAFVELRDLLTEQKALLERLYELSVEERGVIIKGDSARLEEIVRLQLREMSKLNAAEKKRIALNSSISEELGLTAEELTVSAMARKLFPDERAAIVKLREELQSQMNSTVKVNAENRELINAHMEYSEAMLDLMVDSEDPLNNFYGGDGRAAQDKKKATGFFDGSA